LRSSEATTAQLCQQVTDEGGFVPSTGAALVVALRSARLSEMGLAPWRGEVEMYRFASCWKCTAKYLSTSPSRAHFAETGHFHFVSANWRGEVFSNNFFSYRLIYLRTIHYSSRSFFILLLFSLLALAFCSYVSLPCCNHATRNNFYSYRLIYLRTIHSVVYLFAANYSKRIRRNL
jgi:hypothetical protein